MKALKGHHLFRVNLLLLSVLCCGWLFSCNEQNRDVSEQQIVEEPEDINARAEALIRGTLKEILRNDTDLPDSFRVKNADVVQYLYDQNSFEPLWSSKGNFTPSGDSLFAFIGQSREFGLFPEDYYFTRLATLKTQLADTSKEKILDASLWAYSDLLFSSAFVQIVRDLKAGRLLPDSIVAKDTSMVPAFYLARLRSFQSGEDSVFEHLEPQHSDYKKLRTALHDFLAHADLKRFTLVKTGDSSRIPGLLYQRLSEEDSSLAAGPADSLQLAKAIKKYQKKKGMKADGKISAALVSRLNDTDNEKFIRIAINLDRFKLLKPLPEQYLWVNIPAYYLQLRQADTVVLKSRVVVGKPATQTPIITSAISDMITYPKWTIPESIIKKEILPGLKRDPGYTTRKGYSLFDKDGNEVDPYQVEWSKFKSSIPYKVIQGSGDANALGVLKFNFPNQFSVYLHDTNQRYLFSNKKRALSHGCVRVQAWNELAKFILRNDSLYSPNAVPIDSLETWLAAKQKRYVPVRKRLPLFIRYFTCDTDEKGKLAFYDDIYDEDRRIREEIFENE